MIYEVKNATLKIFGPETSKIIRYIERLMCSWKGQLERSLSWNVQKWKEVIQHKTFQLNDLSNCYFQLHEH